MDNEISFWTLFILKNLFDAYKNIFACFRGKLAESGTIERLTHTYIHCMNATDFFHIMLDKGGIFMIMNNENVFTLLNLNTCSYIL